MNNQIVNGMSTGVGLGGSDIVTLALIGAVEIIVLVALMKNYNVELEAETTDYGVKGGLKLNPSV